MDFSDALEAVKDGHRVTRALWKQRPYAGAWLELIKAQSIDGRELMPQLLVGYPEGILRPFAGANWDLLADDWEILEP